MFSSVVTLARVKQRIIHIVQKGIILFHVDNFMAFYANEGYNKHRQLVIRYSHQYDLRGKISYVIIPLFTYNNNVGLI